MPLRIVKDEEKKPGGFKSTQQKGNIVKGKLKSQKELKKITSSDEYKKADYQTKNKMLNVATHKRGALVGGQKKLDKNNNNRIDAQDFKILKAEKAKGRGQGLQDEKMKPGKPMKAVLGALALGAAGAMGLKKVMGKKKKSAEPIAEKMPVGDLVQEKKKQLMGKKRGGGIKKGSTKTPNQFLKKSSFIKRRKKLMGLKSAIGKGGRIGAAAAMLGLAGAGAASLGQKIGRKLSEAKKKNKKMGGGMMQRPGYNVGGSVTVKTKLGRNKPTKMY